MPLEPRVPAVLLPRQDHTSRARRGLHHPHVALDRPFPGHRGADRGTPGLHSLRGPQAKRLMQPAHQSIIRRQSAPDGLLRRDHRQVHQRLKRPAIRSQTGKRLGANPARPSRIRTLSLHHLIHVAVRRPGRRQLAGRNGADDPRPHRGLPRPRQVSRIQLPPQPLDLVRRQPRPARLRRLECQRDLSDRQRDGHVSPPEQAQAQAGAGQAPEAASCPPPARRGRRP